MQIKIRKIFENDSKEIFNLRNDLVTRKFSKNQKKIDSSDHKKWFKNIIKFKKNYFYAALFNKKVVGYIRYEKYDLFYKISISMNKNLRKKGLSQKIIELSEKKINKNFISVAEVKKENKNAINMFIKSKYKIIETGKQFITFCKIVEKQNKKNKDIFSTIGEIKKVRSKNNINWMNILEIAFKNDPTETSSIFKNIQTSDVKITKLSKKLI